MKKSQLREVQVAALLLISVVFSGTASAADFDVTTFADEANACDAGCSLREAITAANATAEKDTITLPTGTYALTIASSTASGEDANTAGDLDIKGDLDIAGAGSATTIIKGGPERVLHVLAGSVTLTALTVTGGHDGGIYNYGTLTLNQTTVTRNEWFPAIFNRGKLTLTQSAVTNNHGANGPGGIYNFFGSLILDRSVVSGNYARGVGGIRSSFGTTIITDSIVSDNIANHNIAGGMILECVSTKIIGSTISNNKATTHGGGIINRTDFYPHPSYCPKLPSVEIVNSTISGNSALGHGGGITNCDPDASCTHGVTTLVNSTVTGNSAGGVGGGLYSRAGSITVKNSIVANNAAADCTGPVTSQGYNLFGPNGGTCQAGGTDKLVAGAAGLGLGPLALNAPGTTQTHALLAGSPAINAVPLVNCKDIATDQRGVARPQGLSCDVGAFEKSNQPPLANAGADQTVEATGPSGAPVTLNASGSTDPDGDPLTYAWTGNFAPITGANPTLTLPLGTHTLTLTVSDGHATSTDTIQITVKDTTPPDTHITSAVDGNGAVVANGGSTLSRSITITVTGTDAVGIASWFPFWTCVDTGGCGWRLPYSPLTFSDLSTGIHTFSVYARDDAGNVDATPASFTWTVVSPAQGVLNLTATVNGLGLPSSDTTSLLASLNEATTLLNDGNPNNDKAVCGKLQVFLQKVDSLVQSGTLTTAAANTLHAAANAIKVSIGCQ